MELTVEIKEIDLEWIQSLKVGDEVAYAEYRSAFPSFNFSKVCRISAQGNVISLASGMRFSKDGFERTTRTYSRKYLAHPETVRRYKEEKDAEFKRTMKTREVRTLIINKISTLTLDGLEKVQTFLNTI